MNSIRSDDNLASTTDSNVEGVVVGKDFGSWAGFTSGIITIRNKESVRLEFHYGRSSIGAEPDIGDLVYIEYNGTEFLEITSIKVLMRQVDTISERVDLQLSGLTTIAGRPKAAVAIVVTEVLVGLSIISIGLSLGVTKPAAPSIYGAVGLAQFIIAWLIWEYTSKG